MRECDKWIIRNNSTLIKFVEDKDLKGLIHEVWAAAMAQARMDEEKYKEDEPEAADIQDLIDELTESINPKNL